MTRATVLCVDDDRGLLDFYETLLVSSGFDAVLAESGEAALRELACHRDSIRVVISDYDMRDMDGAQLAVAIKHLHPSLPVILVSGSHVRLEEAAHLVDATMLKGTSIDRLLNKVSHLIVKPRRVPIPMHRPNYVPLGSALAGVAVAALILPRIWK